MKRFLVPSTFVVAAAILFGLASSSISAQETSAQAVSTQEAPSQARTEGVFNGHRIIYPASSLAQPGHHHTNYFYVDSDQPQAAPLPGVETPGSLACVYQLVAGPAGCPVATSTAVPTGGWGAIAIIDAGSYPTAASDLAAFDSYFGIPAADFTVTHTGTKAPPSYAGWETEEALDIEWAHAMAPQAKLFLVESVLCDSPKCDTDPTWAAVALGAKLVAENGGGVVSMSWGDPEVADETTFDSTFKHKGVVYFAAAGDAGIGVTIYPGSSPNVVSVGGTSFERNEAGDFVNEVYGGGGGALSPYEPRPKYQNGIASIVGTQRGYPDVASDYCCAAVYLQGGWLMVGGTSWGTPTFAGIVNAAASKQNSTAAQLTMMYDELANPGEYAADFFDITQGAKQCTTGWDLCAGIGTPRTYAGK
jgi:kumamolisin